MSARKRPDSETGLPVSKPDAENKRYRWMQAPVDRGGSDWKRYPSRHYQGFSSRGQTGWAYRRNHINGNVIRDLTRAEILRPKGRNENGWCRRKPHINGNAVRDTMVTETGETYEKEIASLARMKRGYFKRGE